MVTDWEFNISLTLKLHFSIEKKKLMRIKESLIYIRDHSDPSWESKMVTCLISFCLSVLFLSPFIGVDS